MFSSLPICRVCLKTSLEYIDFDTPFESDSSREVEAELTYLDCFLACTRLEVEQTESYPQSLCSACGLELKIAYEFIQKAEYADRALREITSNTKLEKLDDEEENTILHSDINLCDHLYDQYGSEEANKPEALNSVDSDPTDQAEHHLDDEKSFVCTVCGEQFFSQFVLNLHVHRSHSADNAGEEKVGKVECQICDLVIPFAKLNSHMQMHDDANCLEYDSGSNFAAANNDEQLIDVGEEADFELLDMTNDSPLGTGDSTTQGVESQEEDTTTQEYEANPPDEEEGESSEHLKIESNFDPDCKFSVIEKILTDQEKMRVTKPNYKRCTVCNRHVRAVSFEAHMNVHNGIRQFSCEHCPGNFFSKRSLQTHIKTSHKDQLKSICRICQESVEGLDMKAHINEKHLRTVKCTHCDYQGQELKMKEHMKRRHAESKDFLCNICSKTFCTLGVLNAHLKYHERKESNVKSDACEICGKVFSTNHYLKSHMLTHRDEREVFECSNCDKTYHSKAALDNHMRMHKGDTIKCLLCSKQFARQYELNVHMRFHTKDYPFECELCGKKFAIKGHLRTHMWRHQGLKLQCEECGKLFTSTKALQEHSFCHSEMPFPCPYCTKAYPSKPKFKVHLKTAHMVEFTNDELQKMSKFPLPKRSRSKKFTLVQADTVMKEVEVHTKEEDEEQT